MKGAARRASKIGVFQANDDDSLLTPGIVPPREDFRGIRDLAWVAMFDKSDARGANEDACSTIAVWREIRRDKKTPG